MRDIVRLLVRRVKDRWRGGTQDEFARIAASGDRERTVAALPSLTAACVACHHAYRIR